jgi:hypothetical protein
VTDERALLAAANNADHFAAMFTAHERTFDRDGATFLCHKAPPPYHSNLTILAPGGGALVPARLQWLSERFGGRIGLKDSYCELELAEHGFRVLFEASWLWRAPAAGGMPEAWERVDYAEAWGSGGGVETQRIAHTRGHVPFRPPPRRRPRLLRAAPNWHHRRELHRHPLAGLRRAVERLFG